MFVQDRIGTQHSGLLRRNLQEARFFRCTLIPPLSDGTKLRCFYFASVMPTILTKSLFGRVTLLTVLAGFTEKP